MRELSKQRGGEKNSQQLPRKSKKASYFMLKHLKWGEEETSLIPFSLS